MTLSSSHSTENIEEGGGHLSQSSGITDPPVTSTTNRRLTAYQNSEDRNRDVNMMQVGQSPERQVDSQIASNFPIYNYLQHFLTFVFDLIPRRIYLFLLLRLPAFYFYRISHIFEEADLTLAEIKKVVLEARGTQLASENFVDTSTWLDLPNPRFARLQQSWSSYIDSLMREWQTLNVVSVLLLTYVRISLFHQLVSF